MARPKKKEVVMTFPDEDLLVVPKVGGYLSEDSQFLPLLPDPTSGVQPPVENLPIDTGGGIGGQGIITPSGQGGGVITTPSNPTTQIGGGTAPTVEPTKQAGTTTAEPTPAPTPTPSATEPIPVVPVVPVSTVLASTPSFGIAPKSGGGGGGGGGQAEKTAVATEKGSNWWWIILLAAAGGIYFMSKKKKK